MAFKILPSSMGLSLSFLMSNSHSIPIEDVGEPYIWYYLFSHFQPASKTGFKLRLVESTHKKCMVFPEFNNFECLKMLNGIFLC